MRLRTLICIVCLPPLLGGISIDARGGDFDDFVKPLLAQKCGKCHGGQEVNGDVNLQQVKTEKELLGNPELIEQVYDALDTNNMPPEDEPPLDEKTRGKLLASLMAMLRESTSGSQAKQLQVRRLNRFQYNHSVKDLFQLQLDVFALPEKLMTRHGNYLHAKSGRMPSQVNVSSRALNPKPGLKNVKAFPKDLRAAHGFDNQANQLTLSPLLLDAFLRLSVSIVESPDFNQQNVGIWNEFFAQPPDDSDRLEEVRRRLGPFLKIAFRGPVESETLDRYAAYAMSKMSQGLSFTDSMKKVASAALSSPLFLYRSRASAVPSDAVSTEAQFALASDLSYFLWGSCPDVQLLQAAERGELAEPAMLDKTITRMLSDPKIERFLDTFPSQWMQLENVLAATPDPQKQRFFRLDQDNPASLQMVLEPLLLFDAVFVEDRPIAELIAPEFSYQSDFLKTWYTSDLKPPKVDTESIVAENRRNQELRKQLQTTIQTTRAELDALIKPVRERILAARKQKAGTKRPIDLKPYAAWEFNGDLKDSINSLDLNAEGQIQYDNGMVVLNRAYLLSEKLPMELKAKSLEVWFQLQDLKQSGGGLMGIQGPGDFFDTIVLGERKAQHWISGSNGFVRTEDFPESTAENVTNEMLHLVMVYTEEGTTTLYRNGNPYGKPFRKGNATFPKNDSSVIFGLRHLPPGGNKFLNVSVDKARLYDRALTAGEVAAAASGENLFVTDQEIIQALTPPQRSHRESLAKTIRQSEVTLKEVPKRQDPQQARQDAQRRFDDEIRGKMRSRTFDRVAAADPRYGGVITSAAMLSMTSGPQRTHPIARGAWIIEVIFNDPPPPPPNDVPPLNEEQTAENLTIREKFNQHRENPDCAGCHSRLDPLGFALENFDITGRWRDVYENGRDIDPSGTLMKKYQFDGIVDFKASLARENRRFAKAFTAHLLRFALSRELGPADSLTIEAIVNKTEQEGFKLKSLIKEVAHHFQ